MRCSEARDALRQELERLGMTLPSLRVEEVWTGAELVHLGAARPDVVQQLVEALRRVPSGE